MSRYEVTELGFLIAHAGSGQVGLSCHVIDTAWNHRLVATYRTEDARFGSVSRFFRRMRVREQARDHAARLNAC